MTARCIKSKKFCKSKHNRGVVALSLVIVSLVVGLSFVYLFQTNSLVSCNFKIRDYQGKIDKLKAESERLEMDIAQWQSPVNLESLVDTLGMIEVGEVVYLENEKQVAVKK